MLRQVTSADGVALAYGDFGPGDGPPVVLCHGLAASGRQFEADAEYFAALGLRVLVPDVRGHGRSGAPPGRRAADFSIARLAADMVTVLEDAGVTAVDWVGNSLGGIIALSLAASAPERLRTLATFGTAYALSLPAIVPALLPLTYAAFGRRVVARVGAAMTTDNRAARVLIAAMLGEFDTGAGRAVAENVRRYDLIAAAQGFSGPILLLRGGRDHAVNRALPRTLAAMADHGNFSRVDVAAAAHCANLDVPDEVRKVLLEFWGR